MSTYAPRELTPLVEQALKTLPVVVVTGLRQAGKTTFLRQDRAFSGFRYFTLDDFATLETARREPEALVEGSEPVIIDEAQRAPELFVAVKRAVDRRREPGRFLLSGSANLGLLGSVSETLAGRALYLTLNPFTRRERLGRTATPPFLVQLLESAKLAEPGVSLPPLTEDEILDGGMPPIVTGIGVSRDLWLLGYEQTYLERDVRDLAQVADLVAFRNLLRLAAHRTAQLLNQSDLARDAHLPVSTASRYLGLLETSFVFSRLPRFCAAR
ncbi:MAG: ATP-binding protein [Thermoanaerobaculia bacterium]|nr:ATP-binding protein [Thermoanaerobaculia bacterium]